MSPPQHFPQPTQVPPHPLTPISQGTPNFSRMERELRRLRVVAHTIPGKSSLAILRELRFPPRAQCCAGARKSAIQPAGTAAATDTEEQKGAVRPWRHACSLLLPRYNKGAGGVGKQRDAENVSLTHLSFQCIKDEKCLVSA